MKRNAPVMTLLAPDAQGVQQLLSGHVVDSPDDMVLIACYACYAFHPDAPDAGCFLPPPQYVWAHGPDVWLNLDGALPRDVAIARSQPTNGRHEP